jgi:hypothetical protein
MPSKTKIIEKPKIKNKEFIIVSLLISEDLSMPFMSSKDLPVIYVIYDGKRGNMQGERNVRIPAEKAIRIETSFPEFIFPPQDLPARGPYSYNIKFLPYISEACDYILLIL